MSELSSSQSISSAKKQNKKSIANHLLKGIFSPAKTASTTLKSPSNRHSISIAVESNSSKLHMSKREEAFIKHSVALENMMESPVRRSAVSPTRNPILQSQNVPVEEPKVGIRTFSLADAERPKTDGPQKTIKTFNNANKSSVFNLPEEQPKTVLKRVEVQKNESKPNINFLDNGKKLLRNVDTKRPNVNPITDGVPENKACSIQVYTQTEGDSHSKVLNDRGLPSFLRESTNQNRGKVFSHTSIDLSHGQAQYEKPQERVLSPAERKMRGEIQGVLAYHDSINLRNNDYTGKCNNVPYTSIKNSLQQVDRTFLRKK